MFEQSFYLFTKISGVNLYNYRLCDVISNTDSKKSQ